jgi:hypothetical protein
MPILVHTIAEAVRRIGVQPYDERKSRDESDQTIAAKTRAQGWSAPVEGRDAPAIRRQA